MLVCECVCVVSCRPVACRHLSWQAGPSRPSAKISPEAAPLLSSFRPGHIALPVWSVCVSVCVCLCVLQWPRQVHSFNQGWLKTDRGDLNMTLTGGRAVSQLQEVTANRARDEEKRGRKGRKDLRHIETQLNSTQLRKKAGDLGQQDGGAERTAGQIIEACVCQESNLVHPNSKILHCHSICPKADVSRAPFVMAVTETNLSE